MYDRPVKCVALDPEFSAKNTRQFATGGLEEKLIINTKGWFSSKNNVLHKDEGPIYCVKWRGSLIAWANSLGVKIFDLHTNQRITYIDRPPKSPRADMYPCNLCWESDNILLIGWADSVKVAQIKEKPKHEQTSNMPSRYVEIVALFQTDYYVAGIAPYGNNLVILAYNEEVDEKTGKTTVLPPDLRIVDRTNFEISDDALAVKGFEHCNCGDYLLGFLPTDSLFYVVAPNDLVVARPRDLDDKISWLLEREQYEKALAMAQENEKQLKTHNFKDIGEMYLASLVNEGEYAEAARNCVKVLRDDPELWEKWVYWFGKVQQLQAIIPVIPIDHPRLSSGVYEMVLTFMATEDTELFEMTVRDWPPELYSIDKVIALVLRRLTQDKNSTVLLDALAELYKYNDEQDKALHIYLKLKRPYVFDLIAENDLFEAVEDKVMQLIEINMAQAIELLTTHTDKIQIDRVVAQLQKRKDLLHQYLHALFCVDPHIGSQFHHLQVALYAEYDYEKLDGFLKSSNYYPLEKAYQVCRDKELYPEMVYVLARMGNTTDALTLIMEKIRDVKTAIDFVVDQRDDDLWEDLIEHSMKKPEYVSELLEHIGAHVDPIKLIARIPDNTPIPNLRNKLVKIIADYHLQMSLREGCNDVLKHDCVNLSRRLNRRQQQAVKVDASESMCSICGGGLTSTKPNQNLIPFFCGHVFHETCLINSITGKDSSSGAGASQNTENVFYSCPLCSSKKKRRGGGSSGAGKRVQIGKR
eukprot:TRINITY_DN1809_c0_g2_i1.p1 TRINITY_DN1809_c0_g2~~TRINITY_DN1809_c0_g2_i1.p1  ORF type:complete len:753 (+),score=264.63 TRINITY_DN1809_c0_g2_i1:263-2521(+)